MKVSKDYETLTMTQGDIDRQVDCARRLMVEVDNEWSIPRPVDEREKRRIVAMFFGRDVADAIFPHLPYC
jgi:hypothetical protein